MVAVDSKRKTLKGHYHYENHADWVRNTRARMHAQKTFKSLTHRERFKSIVMTTDEAEDSFTGNKIKINFEHFSKSSL